MFKWVGVFELCCVLGDLFGVSCWFNDVFFCFCFYCCCVFVCG